MFFVHISCILTQFFASFAGKYAKPVNDTVVDFTYNEGS